MGKWRAFGKTLVIQNPWTQRVMWMLGKDCKLNHETAFFRLRDFALQLEEQEQEGKFTPFIN